MIRPLSFLLSVSIASCLSLGCGRPPAVEIENLPLVASLRTACSARSAEWLEGVARAVEQRHREGQMSSEEKEHFNLLIEQARGGDWPGAEQACLRFEQAQLSRRRAEASAAHGHAHPHAEAASGKR